MTFTYHFCLYVVHYQACYLQFLKFAVQGLAQTEHGHIHFATSGNSHTVVWFRHLTFLRRLLAHDHRTIKFHSQVNVWDIVQLLNPAGYHDSAPLLLEFTAVLFATMYLSLELTVTEIKV